MYPVPIIPEDGSPEQARAVYAFLDELRERVWNRYQQPIIEQLLAHSDPQDHEAQLALFSFNDDLPF